MKRIVLNGPASDNAGHFVDAGASLNVGDAPEMIAAKRAADLVNAGRAVSDDKPAAQAPAA